MISLRNEMDRTGELRRSEEIRDLLAKEYPQMIKTVADYAVEVDAHLVDEFREHLQSIGKSAESSASPADYFDVQSNFRGELRRFHDLSAEQVSRMRNEISEAAAALRKFAEAVIGSGSDLGSQIEGHLAGLEAAAASNDLTMILESIRATTSGLRASYAQMQKANQATIAQLQDEIRLLHKDMAEERKALLLDKPSGAWNRQKVDSRIQELLKRDDPFWILFIKWDLKTDVSHHPEAETQTMRSLVKRLQGKLGKDAMVARWNPHIFAAVVELDPSTEPQLADEIRAHISGMYSIQEKGTNVAVCVSVKTSTVAHSRGTHAVDFLPKLGKAAGLLD